MKTYLITILDEPLLSHHEGKPIKIEVEKSREKITRPRMFDIDDLFVFNKANIKKKKKRNTGVQVTISNDSFPVVTHLQALTRGELPVAYLVSNLPKVWMYKDKLFSELDHVLLEKNEEKPYSRQEIADALLHIRLAGEHLAAVNKLEGTYPKHRQAATFRDGRLT